MAESEINPMADRAMYQPAPRVHPGHHEGTFTRVVEEQAAKIPSSVFLVLALGAMAASALLEASRRTRMSRFVGLWPPALLSMGIYNKIVKSLGPG